MPTHSTPLSVEAWACGMPKAELHIHIGGALEPELVFQLAKRNKHALPFADEEALRRAYSFTDLQSFLDLYFACEDVLHTAEDFHDLMFSYCRQAAADHVIYAEIFFDPQTYAARGIPMAVMMEGLLSGIRSAHNTFPITVRLILGFLRHLSEEDAFTTLQAATPFLDDIVAFGLGSSERDHPPQKFRRVFAHIRDMGKPAVAHAGEEGPPAYIIEALDILQVRRIDHGVRAVEDPALLARLAQQQVPLTVCPLSNVRLCVYPTMQHHPLPQLLAAGVCVTINSDDPAYFGGYLNANIRAVQAAFHFDTPTWAQLARNSFSASFAADSEKDDWHKALTAYIASTVGA